MTDLHTLLSEKAASVAITQCIIDTKVLDQFRETEPQALGSTNIDEAVTDEDTDMVVTLIT